jgi:dimeric dUTPase (all-alpha-NTP-PPase superfamily)
LWKILNKFKRSKKEDKIDIDELYEYFKNLNLSNEVGDSNIEMSYTNDNLANDTIKR